MGGTRDDGLGSPGLIDIGEGFTVEYVGAESVRYSEGAKAMLLRRERLPDDPELSIAPGYMIALWQSSTGHWDAPHDGVELDRAERARILGNALRALATVRVSVWVK